MAFLVDPEGKELEALDRIVDFRGLRVLDVGCGDGRLLWRFADRARSVLGVDTEEDEIGVAERELPAQLRDKVRLRVASIVDLDEPPSSFDLAFFTWSL